MVTSGVSMFGVRRIPTWAMSSDVASCLFSPGDSETWFYFRYRDNPFSAFVSSRGGRVEASS